jgi:hypothetical protein
MSQPSFWPILRFWSTAANCCIMCYHFWTLTVYAPIPMPVANNGGQLADEMCLTRQDTNGRAESVQASNTSSQYFTEIGCNRLMILCSIYSEGGLPEVWRMVQNLIQEGSYDSQTDPQTNIAACRHGPSGPHYYPIICQTSPVAFVCGQCHIQLVRSNVSL